MKADKTPMSVQFFAEKVCEQQIANIKETILYVSGVEYKELPLDANVREPDRGKSKPYKDMLSTLRESPAKFFENNLGVSVIASDIEVKPVSKGKSKVTLTFKKGTGILNGGHTQLAILDAQTAGDDISDAIIRLIVRSAGAYDESRIAEIAAAQNSSTAVKPYSLAEKRGLFATLKNWLKPHYRDRIVWYEGCNVGGQKGMEPPDLIAMLNMFNVFSYASAYADVETQPNDSAVGKGSVFKRWETSGGDALKRIEKIYPLVNDIIDLSEYIQMEFADHGTQMSKLNLISETKNHAKPLVFSADTPKYVIPRQMLLPLLAAFRANVYYGKKDMKIGWWCPNEELFNKYAAELCSALRSSYKGSGQEINRLSKDSTIWSLLYMKLQGHVQHLKGKKPVVSYEL